MKNDNKQHKHMGYFVKRVFLNKNINDDYFIDVSVTNKNERLLWYCEKHNIYTFFTLCLDEAAQEKLFSQLGTDCEQEVFESKLQEYFKGCEPEEYKMNLRSLCDDGEIGHIPSRISRDRESDPHVLMGDRKSLYDVLSEDRFENLLFELIMNVTEEHQLGMASEMTIRVNGCTYEIIDDGDGIAVEDSDEFKDYEWKRLLLYPKIAYDYPALFDPDSTKHPLLGYVDSKYDKAKYYKQCPRYSYHWSSPKGDFLRGDHLAHAQCYAESMKISTIRGGKEYNFVFENGYCVSGRQISDATRSKGTHIVWKPDKCCFYKVEIPFETLSDFVRKQAFLNPGLKIVLDYEGERREFCYPNGIRDYIAGQIQYLATPVMNTKFSFSTQSDDSFGEHFENSEEIEIGLAVGDEAIFESYHNYRQMTWGDTVEGIYEEIVEWFNSNFGMLSFLLQDETYRNAELSVEQAKKHISVVVSSLSEYTSFENGAKKGIKNDIFSSSLKKAIKNMFNVYFNCELGDERTQELKAVLDLILYEN